MNGIRSFQRFAAITAIFSFFSAFASNLLQGIPLHFNPNVMTHPELVLSVGTDGANLLRWGMILDMLGYYLPLLPLALFIHCWQRSQHPGWVHFFTSCGVGYILIGAAGAAILSAIQLPLLHAHAQASGEQAYVLETITRLTWNMVYGGLWNLIGVLLAGIWFLGVGLLLLGERRALATASMVLGISGLLDSLGTMLGIQPLAFLGLSVFLILAPFWALWFGIDLLRKPIPIEIL